MTALTPDDKAVRGAAGRILVRLAPERIHWCFLRRTRVSKAVFLKDSVFLNGLLRRGHWDRNVFPFTDHAAYELLQCLIDSGFDRDTGLAALVHYYTRRGQPRPAERAARKLDDYLAKYGAIARDMERHGYRPYMTRDEIGIALARDGSAVKVSGGNHRLALARLLALPEVVAEIRFAHVGRYPRGPRWRASRVAATIREDARRLDMLPVE